MGKKILFINGPNLNLLGERETDIYGTLTLSEIESRIRAFASEQGAEVEWFQSNSEGEIIERIHQAKGVFDGMVINPAALSYTSYSILDAIRAIAIPTVEVHLSNIFAREDFRWKTVTASSCLGVITGLGWRGYLYALMYLLSLGGKG